MYRKEQEGVNVYQQQILQKSSFDSCEGNRVVSTVFVRRRARRRILISIYIDRTTNLLRSVRRRKGIKKEPEISLWFLCVQVSF